MNLYYRENEYKGDGYKAKSLMLKGGKLTRVINQKQAAELMKQVEDGEYFGSANVVIEFENDKDGVKIAKSFSRLAANPAFKLNVTFKKINKNEITN